MRKASEARDHPVMRPRERQYLRPAKRGKVGQACALVGDRFAMHQRHGKKLPAGEVEIAVPRAGQRGPRNGPRERVARKCDSTAAMDVAGNLVEEQHGGARDQRIGEELPRWPHAKCA